MKPREALWLVIGTLIVLAIGSLFAAWNVGAAEKPQCLPWQKALTASAEQYGEMPTFVAVTAGGGVLTVTVNPKTGTWTAWIQPDPDRMCVASYGEGWQTAPDSVRDAVKPGSPS